MDKCYKENYVFDLVCNFYTSQNWIEICPIISKIKMSFLMIHLNNFIKIGNFNFWRGNEHLYGILLKSFAQIYIKFKYFCFGTHHTFTLLSIIIFANHYKFKSYNFTFRTTFLSQFLRNRLHDISTVTCMVQIVIFFAARLTWKRCNQRKIIIKNLKKLKN